LEKGVPKRKGVEKKEKKEAPKNFCSPGGERRLRHLKKKKNRWTRKDGLVSEKKGGQWPSFEQRGKKGGGQGKTTLVVLPHRSTSPVCEALGRKEGDPFGGKKTGGAKKTKKTLRIGEKSLIQEKKGA